MSLYLLLKWIHILSSTVLVGTGFGTAFYMFFVNRSGVVAAQAVVTRLVVRADWWFTTPAAVIQPVTGFAMVFLAGHPLDSPWLVASFALYLITGACWMPVVDLQIRMAALAKEADESGKALPEVYGDYARRWEALGYPAFVAMLAVFYLMVNRPVLWG
ncbi:MAG: DUF2269 domain-containing protein [Rhodoferax sp.]|nr:DUF2269 domain-containing protein [Rhodoferax sp.]